LGSSDNEEIRYRWDELKFSLLAEFLLDFLFKFRAKFRAKLQSRLTVLKLLSAREPSAAGRGVPNNRAAALSRYAAPCPKTLP